MSTARLMRIANAANAALSNVLWKLEQRSREPRVGPRCEPLEPRLLFQATLQQHILKYCTPHPVRPTPYSTCNCDGSTNAPQNNSDNSGAAPASGPPTKGGGKSGGGPSADALSSRNSGGVHPNNSNYDKWVREQQRAYEEWLRRNVTVEGGSDGATVGPGNLLFGPMAGMSSRYVTDSASELGYSAAPVRFIDGQPAFDVTDISSDGFGATYGAIRSYDPYMADNGGNTGPLGNQWTINNMPYVQDEGTGSSNADINRPSWATDTMVVYTSGSNQRFFDYNGTSWVDRYGGGDIFQSGGTVTLANGRTGVNTLALTDTSGSVTTFVDTGDSQQPGQFISFKDPYSNLTQVTGYDSTTYNIGEIQRSSGSTVESWKYTYLNGPPFNSTGLVVIAKVLLRRSTNGGSSWTNVREADYSFYDGSLTGNMAYGNQGDLRSEATADPNAAISASSVAYSNNGSVTTVTVTANNNYVNGDTIVVSGASQTAANGLWVISNVTSTSFTYTINTLLTGSDSGAVTVNKPFDDSYYRYFTPNNDGGNSAADKLLQFNVGPQAYARARAAGVDPSTASDTTIASYADNQFAYNSTYQVSDEWVQGGTVHTQYGYFTDTNAGYVNAANTWLYGTQETLPDGSTDTIYNNYAGDVLMDVHSDSSGNQWATFYKMNSSGSQIVMVAMPSAVSLPSGFRTTVSGGIITNGLDQNYTDLLNKVNGNYQYLNDSAGLIYNLDFGSSTTATSSTAGDVQGYFKDITVQQGQTGSTTTLEQKKYFSHTANSVVIYPVATDTAYASGSDARTTSYAYTWLGSTNQQQTITVIKPTVGTGQNGAGTVGGTVSSATSTTIVDNSLTQPSGYFIGWALQVSGSSQVVTVTAYNASTHTLTVTPAFSSTPTNGTSYTLTPDASVVTLDQYARVTQTQDGDGNLTTYSYDLGTGAITQTIVDPGSSPHLNLTTTTVVDGLGRPTQRIEPDQEMTRVVYNDANHEMRTYPGWAGISGQATSAGTTTTLVDTNLPAGVYVG